MENTICHSSDRDFLEKRLVGDVLVLTARAAEIDRHTAHAQQQVILNACLGSDHRTIVLDLRTVPLIDAFGWTMLITVDQQVRREGCRLRLLLARGSQPFRAFATRWLHVALDRIDSLEDLSE